VSDRHEIAEPAIDVADETFLRVAPEVLAPLVADPGSWRVWWPDLRPAVTRDRGVKGQQWTVTGALRGSMEVWLEPVAGGTVVHWYLRADPPERLSPRRLRRAREQRVLRWKAQMFALKDQHEMFKDGDGPAESS
jgi:hypothetical protein